MPSSPGKEPARLRVTASGVTCGLIMRAASLLPAARRGPSRGQDPLQALRLRREAAPGDAQRDEPGCGCDGVALAIVLERLTAGVKAPAVQLDDHSLVPEKRVDQVAADLCVHGGPRKAGSLTERQEPVLEAGPGVLGIV